jgi:alpha-tubulin suppressor-like RCC1 family protein
LIEKEKRMNSKLSRQLWGAAVLSLLTACGGGDGPVTVARAPVAAQGVNYTMVSVGSKHSCGYSGGDVYCWGDNTSGQVGVESTASTLVPLRVSGLDDGIDGSWPASAGGGHNCALGFRGPGSQNSRVVRCWGSNTAGQLGDGATTNSAASVLIMNAANGDVVDSTAVSAGASHTCGFSSKTGAAYCWGDNSSGQLGNGTTNNTTTPVAVGGGLNFAPHDFFQFPSTTLSAGTHHTCGVTTAGAAYCWGSNASGQLGNGTTTSSAVPAAVDGGLAFAMVSAGGDATCGVTAAGAAYCWGSNASGQLGNGTNNNSAVPVAVGGGLVFRIVSAGGNHACGVTTAGAAYCWGSNANGQLGDGTTTNRLTPVTVVNGLSFALVVAGGGHSCGTTTGSVAYCWGDNSSGQLGDGTTITSPVPVKVAGQF